MQILNVGIQQAKEIDAFGSHGFLLRHVGLTTGATRASLAYLQPGGCIARHPASGQQLLIALSGTAEVSGADGQFAPLAVGQAALWQPGEEHETRTAAGLTALILDGEFDIHPGSPRE